MQPLRVPTIIALFAVAAGSAGAQSPALVSARDVDAIANVVRGFGSVEVGVDGVGDPKISGRIDGISYGLYFYDCTDARDCKNVQFESAWENPGHVTAADIARWNQTKRFGTAYLDEDGDPALKMSINLDGGVSRANFDDTVDWWRVILNEFRDEVILKE